MAAYFESGFSVRKPMWHGLGTVADEYPKDWAQAREWAGLMWEPELRQLQVSTGPNLWAPVDDFQAVVRPDTGMVLGVVSDEFGLVGNQSMGEIIEAILGADSKVLFETGGSVRQGRNVWALARLDESYKVAGDNTETWPFLALLNAHDGSGACKVLLTQVRVVCWNTIQMASKEGDRTGRQFSFRHVGKPMERIEDAKMALRGLRDEAKEWQELAKALFGMPVDEATLNHFVAEFIPDPPEELRTDRRVANVAKARNAFRYLYLDAVTCEAHRGTALGLLDASTEYLDYVRGVRSDDSRLTRSMLRPEPQKARALNIIRKVVK
jgi:phage/plasmid-like protein (TIGR03299 family)